MFAGLLHSAPLDSPFCARSVLVCLLEINVCKHVCVQARLHALHHNNHPFIIDLTSRHKRPQPRACKASACCKPAHRAIKAPSPQRDWCERQRQWIKASFYERYLPISLALGGQRKRCGPRPHNNSTFFYIDTVINTLQTIPAHVNSRIFLV